MGKNPLIQNCLLIILIVLLSMSLISCGKKREAQKKLPEPKQTVQDTLNTETSLTATDSLKTENTTQKTNGKSPKESPPDSLALQKEVYTWSNSQDIPPVIVIVDDFGYARGSLLQGFIDLPKEITFAVLPDLPYSKQASQGGYAAGHDILIHCPMEATIAKTSPGTRYLKPGQDADTVKNMIDDFHRQMPMAIGLNNHMGSTATQNRELMGTVLKHLNSKGLLFVDSNTHKYTIGSKLARELGYKSIRCDFFLDVPDNSDATLIDRISRLGTYKGRKEPIVIITHCHNQSKLNALNKFLTQITSMGVKLTSLSAYYGAGAAGVAFGGE